MCFARIWDKNIWSKIPEQCELKRGIFGGRSVVHKQKEGKFLDVSVFFNKEFLKEKPLLFTWDFEKQRFLILNN